MLAAAQEGDHVTHALLTVGGAEDVVDAGHDGGDVGDVAAVVHGGCNQDGKYILKYSWEASSFMSCYFLLTLNLIVASKGLLESTAGPGDNNKNNSFL